MAYVDEKHAQAIALRGKRIEIPAYYDLWMRGTRFGTVHSVSKDGAYIRVRMDNTSIRKLVKVWRIDFDYIKVID